MTTFGKRLTSMLVAGSLALTGLVGCGQQAQPEPTSAQELIARYEENENHDNFHMDMDMTFAVDLFGAAMEMPIKGSFDVVGEDSHGTLSMDMSSLGIDKYEAETYMTKDGDSYVQYTGVDEDGTKSWTTSTLESGSFTQELTSADLLKDAEFTKLEDASVGAYQLTIPGTKFVEALSSMGGETESLLGSEQEAMADALKDSEARFVFDKDCMLTSIAMNLDMSYESEEAAEVSASIGLNTTMTLSNYGKIDAASVAVPEEVKNTATSQDEALQELGSLLGTEEKTEDESLANAA